MATEKFTALSAATSLTGVELIPIIQGGENKTATPDLIFSYTDMVLRAFQAMGSTIKAMSIGMNPGDITGSVTLLDGRAVYVAVYLPLAQTITGVKMIQHTQGAYTADNFNGVALYSVSGGTLTQRAVSDNDGTIWKATTGTMITKAFNATYDAPAGLYYVAFLYNSSAESTAPKLASSGDSVMITGVSQWDFTNNLFLSGNKTGSNSLPTPTIESSTITVYVAPPFVRH
jgi:hypothetical protein